MDRKERFKDLGTNLGTLVGEKDEHYGEMMESTRLFLLSIFPDGISVDQYEVVGLLVRIFDKQKRSTHGGHDKAEDFRDIAGYGLQGLNYYCAAEIATGGADKERAECVRNKITAKMLDDYCKDRIRQKPCHTCPIGKNAFVEQITCKQYVELYPDEVIQIMRKAVE